MAEPAPARRRRHGGRRRERGEVAGLLRELPILIVVALGLALLIKTFLVQAFFIPSDSMENTLKRGDRVLVNKLSTHFGDIERGQVIVFRDPGHWLGDRVVPQPRNPIVGAVKQVFIFVGLLPSDSEQDLIKRVVGVPGDRVRCCEPNGRVSVNGVPLDETYLFPGNPPSDRSFDVTVPPGRLWAMGDHRAVSADSRAHRNEAGGGTIPKGNVVGRAFVVVWPPDRWAGLPVPPTYDTGGLTGALPFLGGAVAAWPAVFLLRRSATAVATRRRTYSRACEY